MNFFQKMWQLIVEAFRPRYNFAFIEDLPEEPSINTIYLLGNPKEPWCCAFLCPCGCRETIELSLLKEDSPCWKISFSKRGLSLWPSINRVRGCRSHFFVTRGRIQFCRT